MSLEIHPQGSLLPYGVAPYPFVRTSGHEALAVLGELRSTWQDATAVVWGDPTEASQLFQIFEEEPSSSPGEVLERARVHSAIELMDAQRASHREQYAAWCMKRGKPAPEFGEEDVPPRGAWPDAIAPHQVPLSLFDQSKRLKPEVLIGLVPTARSFEVPAYHLFGSRNRCPAPEVHVAIGREFAGRYGARLIVNTFDAIEYEVDAPVASREEALRLAELHYRYCADVVTQGHKTLERLAASLIGARYWFFWWD